jgi:hypothetical protein
VEGSALMCRAFRKRERGAEEMLSCRGLVKPKLPTSQLYH